MKAIVLPGDVFEQDWSHDPRYLTLFINLLAATANKEQTEDLQADEYICTYRDLAAITGLQWHEIGRLLKALEKFGLLERYTYQRKDGHTCTLVRIHAYERYQLDATRIATENEAFKQGVSESVATEVATSALPPNPPQRERLTQEDTLSLIPPIVPPSPSPIEPRMITLGEKSGKTRKRSTNWLLTLDECYEVVCENTPSEAVREAAMGWLQMRYSKKRGDHRCTRRAIMLAMTAVRKMAKTEAQAVAVFNQSEINCWDGLFEVKQ